jgi:hypothetical protein
MLFLAWTENGMLQHSSQVIAATALATAAAVAAADHHNTGHVDCAALLIESQASVSADCDGCPCLHLAVCNGALPGREGVALQLVQLLLAAGADPMQRFEQAMAMAMMTASCQYMYNSQQACCFQDQVRSSCIMVLPGVVGFTVECCLLQQHFGSQARPG